MYMAKNEEDTYSYKGWLTSDNFLKRAFGVLGYNFVAGLIIWAISMAVMLVFGLLLGGLLAASI